ncbi:MAG: serine/threonine-protein phosphatase [Lachnospiraceae bacterium]|nr:serine/threonine-protein phosphatase [Lachnospiraceae bacterium]
MRICAYNNDIGIKKKVNQDAILIKEASTNNGDITLLVVCDGMGGLSSGEVASGEVIRGFDEWFDEKLAYVLSEENVIAAIKREWDFLIKEISRKLFQYGEERHLQLGTTCSAFIILSDNRYVIAHIGDSRVYQFREHNMSILTTDHTFIAKEMREGRLTEEEAKVDPRRNMLLQAIGACEYIEIEMLDGLVCNKDLYMLCSDGLRHKISEVELIERFSDIESKEELDNVTDSLVELVKERGEVDNISVIAVKILED